MSDDLNVTLNAILTNQNLIRHSLSNIYKKLDQIEIIAVENRMDITKLTDRWDHTDSQRKTIEGLRLRLNQIEMESTP